MAQARLLVMPNGERMMSHEPHPIVGWARFLEHQRLADPRLTNSDRQRLREAIHKAEFIYSYWRPELRYKVVDLGDEPLRKVQKAAKWLLDNQPQL